MNAIRNYVSVRNLRRYLFALALLISVSFICYGLNSLLGFSIPLMLFTIATIATAWFAGFGPGLVTTLGGAVLTSTLFKPLVLDLSVPALLEDSKLVMAMIIGAAISWAFASLRRLQAVAEKNQHEAVAREKHYRSILDSLASFVGVLSPEGRIIYTNDASVRIVDESRESMIGQQVPHTPWFKDLPEEKTKMIEALARANRGENVRLDVKHRNADGSLIDLDLSISPMRDEAGVITHLIPSALDITERKTREERLRKAELEADAANKAKTLFLANVSHEIRTPLGIMLGFAELLRDSQQSSADKDYYIDSIARNGRQLTRIIDEILDVSKIEAARMEIDRVDFSLRDFSSDIREFVELSCREKGLDFEFSLRLPQSLNRVVSDPARLRQIILNLTSNAVKFSDKGSITVRLSADIEADDEARAWLTVDVIDSGPGVKADQLEKLFLPFSQADNSMTRKFGGTGLGLYVSRKLACALGGDVQLQPAGRVGGAHFTLTAPLRLSAVVTAAATDVSESQLLQGLRILVVEDSPDNQHLISRYLSRAGGLVECVSNGLDGCSRALHGPFDVVLMDLQMPIMDGYEAIQKLRDVGYSRPVIALTAHAFPAERQRCFDLGFDEHLVKPIDRKALLDALRIYNTGRRSAGTGEISAP